MPVRPGKLFRDLLATAERWFGRRHGTWKLRTEGRDNPTPECVADQVSNSVTVYFANEAKSNIDRLRFQLSHEAIHCVSGCFKREALFFEEGLAVQFSMDCSSQAYREQNLPVLPTMFKKAWAHFERLRATDAQLRELRTHASSFDDLTPDILVRVLGADPILANALCERVPPDDSLRF
jgi:hypothetical protein